PAAPPGPSSARGLMGHHGIDTLPHREVSRRRGPAMRKEPDGKRVPDGEVTTLAVWDAPSGELGRTLEHKVTDGLGLSPERRLLAGWDEGGEITVWLLPEGRPVTTFRVSRSRVDCLAFGRDPLWHDAPALALPPWLLAVGD